MDTSVAATPSIRAWGLLADLAAYIVRDGSVATPDGFTREIAQRIQAALACPWGRLTLTGLGDPVSSSWGRDDLAISQIVAQLPADVADVIEIPLTCDSQPVGALVLGLDADSRGILMAEFMTALRDQLQLLIHVQQNSLADQRYSLQLSALQRASSDINGALNADLLLKALYEGVRSIIAFKAIEVCLYHRQSQSLAIALSRGVRHRSDHSHTYRLNEGLVGWIARHRRSLRLGDLQAAPVRPNFVSLHSGVSIRSYLGMPIQSEDWLLGTLEIFSDVPGTFTANDERALAIIAAQVAQALAGMQRHEQADEHLNARMQQLRALQRISRELTATLYLHNILGFALDEAIRATQADSGYIALRGYQATQSAYDLEEADVLGVTPTPQVYIAVLGSDEDRAMRVIATNGYARDDVNRLLNQPLVGGTTLAERCIESGEELVLDDASSDDRPLAVGPPAASGLAVPIYYEAQVIGVINLHSQVPFTFDRDALDFVRAVADQIALAIGNEQRWTEQRRQRDLLQQRANTLSEVLRIGQELRADRSLSDVLEQIAFSIVETAGFRAVVFYVSDTNQPTMQLITGAGLPLTKVERLRQVQVSLELVQQFTNDEFLVGRCFYVPGAIMRAIAPGLDLIDGDVVEASESWQADDALFVPLYSTRGQLIGLLSADEPYDHMRPSRRAVESLEIFADQAAIAIENTGLLREARGQAEQMTALHRASISAAATLNLEDLVHQTYEEIASYMGVPSFMYVASYDPLREAMRFEIFMREGRIHEQYHQVAIPKGGWTGYVIDTGVLLHVHDALDEQASQPSVKPVLLGETIRSFLGIPLLSQGQVIGVLSVQSFDAHAFSDSDVQFLSTLANQLAVALDKVRLFGEREQRIEELNVINRIARITSSSLGVEQILNEVHACLAAFLPIDAFFCSVYDQARDEIGTELFVDAGNVTFDHPRTPPRPGSMTEWILRNRRPLRFSDLRTDDDAEPFVHSTFGDHERQSASWLGVPLLVGDSNIVGVISIQSYTPSLYGEREQSFLTTVASQIALGIQNAQLLDQAQAQVRQLELLNQASVNAAGQLQSKVGELSTLLEAARVLSSSLKPQAVLDSLMDVVRRQLQVNTVALWRDNGDRTLLPVAMLGIPNEVAKTLSVPVGQGMTGRVAAIGEPLVVVDVENKGSSLYPSFNRANSYTSFMGVPVRYSDQIVGVLSVMTIEQRDFSSDEVQLLAGMADQAAVALENARLFEEREKRIVELTTLNRISQDMNGTLDVDEMVMKLYKGLGDVFALSEPTIALYDEETETISFPIFTEQGVLATHATSARLHSSDAKLSSTVITTRSPLMLNTRADVEAIAPVSPEPSGQQIASWLGVPIMLGSSVLGVLHVQRYEAQAFNEDDKRFLETVASQAASALGNARLFTERERRIEELATLNQIGQELSAGTAQADLLETLYRQMGRLIDTNDSYIALYDDRSGEITYPRAFEHGQRYEIAPFKINDRSSLTGHIIRTRSTVHLNGAVDALAAEQGIDVYKYGTAEAPRSWLGVPMVATDKVVGVIAIQSLERENVFSADDVRLLETIAAWGATALENARLISESRQSIRELTVLYEVSIALASTLDLNDIQTTATSSVLELLSVDLSMVTIFDDRRRLLPPTVTDTAAVPLKATVLSKAVKPLVASIQPGQPLGISRLRTEMPKVARATGLQSLLGVPIVLRDEQIGIIWVGYRSERDWQAREISLLSIFANQLSQTIARARLLMIEQERRQVADTLRETAQMFTRLRTVEGIYELIFDQLERVLDFDTASLMLRREDRVFVIGGRGFAPDARITDLSFALSEDANLRRVVETKGPMVLDDAQLHPNFVVLPATEHIHGWIAAPLLVDDDVIGLLCVDSKNVGAYDQEAANITFALASQAAQALRNARLYAEVTQLNADLEQRVLERTAELQEEQDRLRAVHAITLELTATLELQPTLNRALELAADAVDARRGSIMLRETNTPDLICRAVLNSEGLAETTEIRMDFGQSGGLVGWVMQTRDAVCIADVRDDPRWLHDESRAGDVRSVIAAPLLMQDGPLGVLMLSSPRPDFFRDAQVQLLTTIANEIAIVLHNATLYNIISELANEKGNAEAQQREENSKNQAVLSSLGEGVIVLDEEQQVVLFNPAAEVMLGIPSAYITGQSLQYLIQFADSLGNTGRAMQIYEGINQGLIALVDQSKNYNRMLSLLTPAQTIAMNFAPWVGPRGANFGSVVVLRDVTREIESDRAKRDFISSVSHELRTPLTSIKGYVDLLLLGAAGPVPDSQLSFLNVVKNNANRLMDLINDILEIGRIDSDKIQLNYEPVNIRDIFSDVLQTLRVQIDRKAMLASVEVAEDVPEITADLRRMTQVVLNLVSNAVKYTFPEGRLLMRSFLNPAGMLQIEVEDSGVGISVEDQRNLFRRFQRFDNPLRDEAGGTGLGLSIAKSFVELHGGEMWVTSEPGQGSTFSFIIPVTQPEVVDADFESIQ